MTRALRTALAAAGLSIALVAGPALTLTAAPLDDAGAGESATAPAHDGWGAGAMLRPTPPPTALTLWIGAGAAMLLGGTAVVAHTVRRERAAR